MEEIRFTLRMPKELWSKLDGIKAKYFKVSKNTLIVDMIQQAIRHIEKEDTRKK